GAGDVPQPVIDPEAMQQHQRRTPALAVDPNRWRLQTFHAHAPSRRHRCSIPARIASRVDVCRVSAPDISSREICIPPEIRPMKNGMLIIDADGHAADNEAVYRERLPEQYRRRTFV